MDVINFSIFAIGVTFFIYTFWSKNKEGDVYRAIIAGISAYLVIVCIVSVSLLLCNFYDPLLSLSLTIIALLPFVTVPDDQRRNLSLNQLISRYRYLIIFVLLMIPIIVGRYEYITMDGDNGVYAVRGIQIESERNLFSRDEIRSLLHGEIRDKYDADNLMYFNKTTGGGFYLPGTHLVTGEDSEFYFHAYPAWPVLLATWGSIFGITAQHYVMVLLYALIVSLMFFILTRFLKNSAYAIALTVLFGSSPLLVQFSKYGTAELFLLFLVLFAIHLMSQTRLLHMILAGLSITLFSWTHISSFAYAPLLLLAIYYFASEKRADRYYLFLGISFLGFLLSIPYGYYVSKVYFINVYKGTFHNFGLGLIVVLFIGIIGLILSSYNYLNAKRRSHGILRA
jgi:hypothetical protein